MRIADGWKDYELLDCSCGERLERWGDVILIRPDPQVIWQTPKNIRCGKKQKLIITVLQQVADIGKCLKKHPMLGVLITVTSASM